MPAWIESGDIEYYTCRTSSTRSVGGFCLCSIRLAARPETGSGSFEPAPCNTGLKCAETLVMTRHNHLPGKLQGRDAEVRTVGTLISPPKLLTEAACAKARIFSRSLRNGSSGAMHIVRYVFRKGSQYFPYNISAI